MHFEKGDKVLLKVSPTKGVIRFGKKGKLSLSYIEPFEILNKVGFMDYRLALPPSLLGVHAIFNVSILKKYHGDKNYIIHWDSELFDKELSYEEETIAILDRDVRELRTMIIPSVKVQFRNHPIKESTRKTEADMQKRYPQLFTNSSNSCLFFLFSF